MPSNFKAFVSSTYVDLKEHRAHVIQALRKAEISVDPMEDWAADPGEPKDFSRQRLDGCDLFVLLVAFRRGFVPDGESLSITQLEYRYAVDHQIDVLAFVLDEEANWKPRFDERRDDPDIVQWRSELMQRHGVGLFGLEPRSIEIGPALARWLQKQNRETTETPTLELDVPVIPKGLRPFDAQDRDFFLQLVPGPRDNTGLPQSVRFWKNCVELGDGASPTVGLIWGPSGCGKTSLVRAGLLPRLDDVKNVYVEATPDGTEQQLLNQLRQLYPDLARRSLVGAISALSKPDESAGGRKTLIVLDQFEQWLHGRPIDTDTPLVQALRKCDGRHVQCIVMVRDDFWTAISRFMNELDVEIREGRTSTFVDLFDIDHAQQVLTRFGRAYDKVVGDDPDAATFIQQAVGELTDEYDKVVAVQLALFADMTKSQPWNPGTLKEVGGAEGVGISFLEATLGERSKYPILKRHGQAARSILKSLNPDLGTDIKGARRSREQLLTAADYHGRSEEFDDILKCLDQDVRLIRGAEDDKGDSETTTGQKHYQLTHDYLVRSVREWIRRKQKQTRRGRAEIRLEDRTQVWNSSQVNRHLPAWWEFFNIRWFTRKPEWTETQQRMMSRAGRYHAIRGSCLLTALILLCWGGYEGFGRFEASRLVRSVGVAELQELPGLVDELKTYRRWAEPKLEEMISTHADDSSQKLQATLMLVNLPSNRDNNPNLNYLFGRLVDADPPDAPIMADLLASHKDELLDRLWGAGPGERLAVATVLAKYAPTDDRWENVRQDVARKLVSVSPFRLSQWIENLRAVRTWLIEPLETVFRNPAAAEPSRAAAAVILANYADDQPEVLARLLADAEQQQFDPIFQSLRPHAQDASRLLHESISETLDDDTVDDTKETLTRQQANAAAALLRMGQTDNVWPLLMHSPDPRLRSYLIDRFASLDVDPAILWKRLGEERDPTARRALILSLGEFQPDDLSEPDEKLKRLTEWYRKDPDPGIHGAVQWTLRQWKQGTTLNQLVEELQENERQLSSRPAEDVRRWYVNGEGQTYVILEATESFQMGSPEQETDREFDEELHSRLIGRTFAIGATEVTREQFERFQDEREVKRYVIDRYSQTKDSPQLVVDWYDVAAYCNWLSEKEGILPEQWCYMVNSVDHYAQGMQPAPDYLTRVGYRLPTEAEWEFACRSDTATARYYGQTAELLPKYGWYLNVSQGRAWPVASLKPNDFGLFDMQGNAIEWCHESYDSYSSVAGVISKFLKTPRPDVVDNTAVSDDDRRVLRVGSFGFEAHLLRSANRVRNSPSNRYTNVGFRVARTVTTEPP